MVGKKFGKLTVLKENGRNRKEVAWECLCDCGNVVTVSGYYLRSGHTKSCGCFTNNDRKSFRYIHSNTQIARAYTNIKTRCYNKSYCLYRHYGGKGIKVCDEWLGEDGFERFYNWSLSNGYKKGLSIDRIDNSKDYSPDNCRWVTMKVQQNNRTNNHRITVNGVSHTMKEWSEINEINYGTIQSRLERGWTETDAVTMKAGTR